MSPNIDPRRLGVPKEVVREAERTLRNARGSLETFLSKFEGTPPAAGSPAHADQQWAETAHHRQRTPWRRLQAWATFNTELSLINALDHTRAIERVLLGGEPVNVWPCVSLSRVVMESCVRLCHTRDAGLSPERRHLRMASAWLASSHKHLVAAREFKPDQTLAEAERAWATTQKTVTASGMTIDHNTRGKPSNVSLGAAKESLSADFISMVRDRPTHLPSWYRISSGASHNTAWLVQQAVGFDDAGQASMHADPAIITAATLAVLGAFEDVTQTLGTYHGIDPGPAVRTLRRRTLAVTDLSKRWTKRMAEDAEALFSE